MHIHSRPTSKFAGILLQAALKALLEADGSLSSGDVNDEVLKRVKLEHDEYKIYSRSGLPKWKSVLFLQSINMVKAGWIQKRKGIWYLTETGAEAAKMSPEMVYQ